MRRMTRERVEELAGIDALRHCGTRELATLAGVLRVRAFRADETLCRTGEQAGEVFLVREGTLAVRADGEVVATLETGAIAGEIGPPGDAARAADLVAIDDGSVFVSTAASLRWAMAECPGLGEAITPLLADRADDDARRHAC